jgi:hypothetical protein
MNFFKPLEAHVQIGQKVLKYTPVQKLEMFLVAVLAGAKAVSQSETTVRLDPALRSTFGLPGCAEPSSITTRLHTRNAGTGSIPLTCHHLVNVPRLPGDGQVQVRRSRAQVGAWDQHLAAHLQSRPRDG